MRQLLYYGKRLIDMKENVLTADIRFLDAKHDAVFGFWQEANAKLEALELKDGNETAIAKKQATIEIGHLVTQDSPIVITGILR